mmetsp:Transcript_63339/g.105463  ORF Transcript_63339/g.105463 Transcript_63339/m.105463 type:complete len:113 (+) Transcript_63339:269-607(+)
MDKCAVCDSTGSPLTVLTTLEPAQQALFAQGHPDQLTGATLCAMPYTVPVFHNKGCITMSLISWAGEYMAPPALGNAAQNALASPLTTSAEGSFRVGKGRLTSDRRSMRHDT